MSWITWCRRAIMVRFLFFFSFFFIDWSLKIKYGLMNAKIGTKVFLGYRLEWPVTRNPITEKRQFRSILAHLLVHCAMNLSRIEDSVPRAPLIAKRVHFPCRRWYGWEKRIIWSSSHFANRVLDPSALSRLAFLLTARCFIAESKLSIICKWHQN